MFRHLLICLALAAELMAAGPVLADAPKPAAATQAKPATCTVPCPAKADQPDRQFLGVVGQGWG